MKKYALLLIALIFVGCGDEDLPNQFTSVEGYVSDYYTNQFLSNISLVITEHEPFISSNVLDTLFTDSKGFYYFEFYNDSNRFYSISTLPTDTYAQSKIISIDEGVKNTLNFTIKKYIHMHLKCINNTKTFSRGYFTNIQFKSEYLECDNYKNGEANFHIIPEEENVIFVFLEHVNEMNQTDSILSTTFKFFSGINDTTITYNY